MPIIEKLVEEAALKHSQASVEEGTTIREMQGQANEFGLTSHLEQLKKNMIKIVQDPHRITELVDG
jgi:flagellar basal body P-ring protein FlgI